MSILDFSKNNDTATRTSSAAQDRPAAKMWLNVGYVANGKFVNLPVGIPVDTMEALPIRGQNEDWAKLQSARNGLLKAIQDAGDALAPGAEVELKLVVRLRKVNSELVVLPEDNEFSTDFSGLVVGTVAPAIAEPAAA